MSLSIQHTAGHISCQKQRYFYMSLETVFKGVCKVGLNEQSVQKQTTPAHLRLRSDLTNSF